MTFRRLALAGLMFVSLATPAFAAKCGSNAGGFAAWLADFRKEAAAAGMSGKALATLDGLTYDTQVIRLDRNQKAFKISYEKFVAQRVTPRLGKARAKLKQHAKLLSGIEKRYGVPKEIVVAIWAMETDFGVNRGNMNVFRSLATLAYDCRRSAFFTNELMSALKIVQKGWMSPASMRGAWAGEIGQTQFLASKYLHFAVDYDGDGRRNLVGSTADVLASTANYLKGHGWQTGGGFNQAALAQWNKSDKYQRALAYFAQKLAGG
ncbi:MAG: lytic murein transglycosylase [Hyphomicrobiaceae bacterium]